MKMMPRRLLVLPAITACLLIAGCIYSFNPSGKSSLKSIAIERFGNETGEFGLADRLTDLVIDGFLADGNLKVVSPELAEGILVAKLLRYERLPHVFDENDQVEQYKVRLGFEVALQNPADRSSIWSEQMNPEGIYSADTETEEDGQRRAAEALVEAILNKTTKSW